MDMHKASSFWGIFCCTISGHCIDVGESMGNKREKRIKFSVPGDPSRMIVSHSYENKEHLI